MQLKEDGWRRMPVAKLAKAAGLLQAQWHALYNLAFLGQGASMVFYPQLDMSIRRQLIRPRKKGYLKRFGGIWLLDPEDLRRRVNRMGYAVPIQLVGHKVTDKGVVALGLDPLVFTDWTKE